MRIFSLQKICSTAVDLSGDLGEFEEIGPVFYDTLNDTTHRNHSSVGGVYTYVNETGRNDIDSAKVSKAIAAEDKDFASSNMLVWFVDEQVEEEESARDMITACEAVEGNKFGLYTLDKELAARVYQQASPLATATE